MDHNLTITYYQSLQFRINYYFILIVVPIGIITNVFSIVISIRKNMNKTNMGFFNISMALGNILQLCFYSFVLGAEIWFNFNLANFSDFTCKSINFSRRIIRQIPPLIETIMTIDRFVNVFYPKRFTLMNKKSFLLLLITISCLIFALIDISNLFYYLEIKYQFSADSTSYKTIKHCTGTSLIMELSDIGAILLRTILPFMIMLILNILIIKRILKTRLRSTSVNYRVNNCYSLSSRTYKRQYQYTLTVIGMNGTFLLLNFPLAFLIITKYVYLRYYQITYLYNLDLFNLIFTIFYSISTLHYASLFFINIFCNNLFYNEIRMIIISRIKFFYSNKKTGKVVVTRDHLKKSSRILV